MSCLSCLLPQSNRKNSGLSSVYYRLEGLVYSLAVLGELPTQAILSFFYNTRLALAFNFAPENIII